jgi:hypothetical protein
LGVGSWELDVGSYRCSCSSTRSASCFPV